MVWSSVLYVVIGVCVLLPTALVVLGTIVGHRDEKISYLRAFRNVTLGCFDAPTTYSRQTSRSNVNNRKRPYAQWHALESHDEVDVAPFTETVDHDFEPNLGMSIGGG
jgi:hypothetical protein